MGARRLAGTFVVVAWLVLLAMPTASQARLYDPDGDCVVRAGDSGYRAAHPGGRWDVLGSTRSTRAQADRADAIIRRKDIWSTYSDELGSPRHDVSAGGRELPFQIFISDEIPPAYAGYTLTYCGPPEADSILINPVLDDSELANTLAHELFHAFSNGHGAGDGSVSGWWAEATATWGSIQLAPHPVLIENLDEQFLQVPNRPLDKDRADSEFRNRPYGAWRLVQWLETWIGTDHAMYQFLLATFRRMAAGEDGTHSLLDELAARRRDLGEDLGHFWGDHLRPTSPLNGPATRGRREVFSVEDPASGTLTETRRLTAEEIAADVVRLKLPRDSNVRRITISADRAPSGAYLWVQNGNDLDDWTEGGEATFCVGGYSPATGAKAWAGQFPVAFTNGNTAPGPISHEITIEVGAEECDEFVEDPTAAVDESPTLDLPGRCPGTPVYFRPPDLHTDYFVFRERLMRVYESQVDWQHVAVGRIIERDLGRRSAGRLLARWLYCGARRARGIDNVPDRRLRRWRSKFVELTRRAARIYEHGEFQEPIELLAQAGEQYGKMIARATAQDVATAPSG